MSENGKKLTLKQKLFIEEYLKDFNSSRAARAAGYSEKAAHFIGSENIRKPYIREEITKRVNELLEEKRELVSRVIEETGRIATSDIREFVDDKGNIKCFAKTDTRPLASFEIIEKKDKYGITTQKKVRLLDKNKALENMAKYIGLCKDNIEVKGGKIELVIPKDFIPACNLSSDESSDE